MRPQKSPPPTEADIKRQQRAAVVIERAMTIADGDPGRAIMAIAEAYVILEQHVSPGFMRLKRE